MYEVPQLSGKTTVTRRPTRALILLALVSVATGLAQPAAAAAADQGPRLENQGGAFRGRDFYAVARDLVAGATYTVVTDGGAFRATGTTSTTVVANENDSADALLIVSDALPATQPSFDVKLEDSSGTTTLDDETVVLRAPVIEGSVCPGTSGTFTGLGLPADTYSLSGQQVTFGSSVTVTDGTFTATGTTTDAIPPTFKVTATSTTDPAVAYTVPITRETPDLSSSDPANWGFWRARFTATCFAPHETITAVSTSTAVSGERTVADAHGGAHIVLDLHPSAQPRRIPNVTFTGQTSRQVVTVGAGIEVLGTTLAGGQKLTSSGDYWGAGRILVAPTPGYLLANGNCNPSIAICSPTAAATLGHGDSSALNALGHAPSDSPKAATCT